MLDKLSAIPLETLSKIRHMRVSGEALDWIIQRREVFYTLGEALEVLPGLCLDQLTVVCTADKIASYHTFCQLVLRGRGWKTLRFVHPTAAVVSSPKDLSNLLSILGDYVRQRNTWRALQFEPGQTVPGFRNGWELGLSMTVYHARESGHRGLIPQPNECVEYKRKPVRQLPGWYPDVAPKDTYPMGKGEKGKELMVVAKREGPPLVNGHLGKPVQGPTWYEIGQPSPWTNGRMLPEVPSLRTVDDYNDPEEHVWTPRHLCENPDLRHFGCDLDER
ncbi:hypothetical protein F5144DRAFT_569542 [Chaetomium tenue]|uniref:Uncharacterized protein n=1 Tax=Chaetomium tenue TaxID=1854479 RepID=A0ACB7PFF6_9PEZI|nr:hypothetical protein F5144DRAFT_569542 [Chaetomium globosum]